MIPEVIARLIYDAVMHNTIATRTIPIRFQRFPGIEAAADDRGITGMDYRVMSNGAQIQSGQTPANGLIDCQVRGANSTLQIMFNGAVVSEYTVSIVDAAFDAVTTVRGRQQRMMMLGYDLGASGVDGSMGGDTEKAMLMFQADKGLNLRGTVGQVERDNLTADAGE
jgi:hypothetical protein